MEAKQLSFLVPLRALTIRLSKQATDTLPPIVCGLLSSLLPPLPDLAHFRAGLATYLRITSDRAVWLQGAELAEVCAVFDGLHAYDPQLITGTDIAVLTQRLIAAEAEVGGPYQELDGTTQASTNAFINQVLQWAAEPLPNVSTLLTGASKHFASSQLTPAEQTLLYALEHTADSNQPSHLKQLQAHSGLLMAALAAHIVYASEQDGPSSDGLRAHVTAVYAQSQKLPISQEPFSNKTTAMLRMVMRADNNYEIAALAWMYGRALGYTDPSTDALYQHLGIANVYAWAAYTIYDDFLDEEGTPSLLATANYCLRACLREYHAALPDASFQAFVEQALSIVDTANTYETIHLRFATTPTTITVGTIPSYDTANLLADRALFHVIGPMGVLAASGEPVPSATWNQTLTAFRHYLIARQLNDDIHDWVKDLRAGQISFVVAALLRHLGTVPGTYNLDELLALAQPVFWQEVLPSICNVALEHIGKAKQMPFPNRDLFADSKLMRLFAYVENSMRAADKQRITGQDFLNHFTGPDEA